MANETFGYQSTAYGRVGADQRWATIMGRWHENRFGEEVQQFLGAWVPDNTYALTDEGKTVPPEEHAEAAMEAAKAKGQHVGLQFSEAEPYSARRGEASTT